MTNTITILAIVLIGFSVPSAFACTPENTIVWSEITFDTQDPLGLGIMHNSEPTIGFGEIAVPHTFPFLETFESAPQKVADQLNKEGYFVEDSNGIRSVTGADIDVIIPGIGDFFSTTCLNDFSQIIGGLLIQPDATAFFLAYGIANAIWLAPTLAGIGAGIYLTKNKWKR